MFHIGRISPEGVEEVGGIEIGIYRGLRRSMLFKSCKSGRAWKIGHEHDDMSMYTVMIEKSISEYCFRFCTAMFIYIRDNQGEIQKRYRPKTCWIRTTAYCVREMDNPRTSPQPFIHQYVQDGSWNARNEAGIIILGKKSVDRTDSWRCHSSGVRPRMLRVRQLSR